MSAIAERRERLIITAAREPADSAVPRRFDEFVSCFRSDNQRDGVGQFATGTISGPTPQRRDTLI